MDIRKNSAYNRQAGDMFLAKINSMAITVPTVDEPQAVTFWLKMARTSMGRAEAALNATATDLKAAYIHFTRAAMILEEIVPGQSDFRTFDKDRYLFIREILIPSLKNETNKLWNLIEFREMPARHKTDPVPYFKATISLRAQKLVLLLPTKLRFDSMVQDIRSAFYRRGLFPDLIGTNTPILLTGPMMQKRELVMSSGDLEAALDTFREAFNSEEPKKEAEEGNDLPVEELPPYSEVEETRRRPSLEIAEDFSLSTEFDDLYADNGILQMAFSFW